MNRFLLTLFLACSAATLHAGVAADSLDTLTHSLRSVDVRGRRVRSSVRSEGGATIVGMELMNRLPRILGNADPMHYAQMLPGVQTNAEYDAGLHIQGSDNAHNQVSVNGVPLYSVAHLLGFFSIFNPTHFSSMRLAKATAGACSPNRLGGTLDMLTDTAAVRRTAGDVSVGPMSSQATVRLPLSDRSWLTLSARAAYLNLLYSQWLKVDGEAIDYFFHDYNLTYTVCPDGRNLVRVDAYYGGDDVDYAESNYGMDTSLRWYNAMAAVHWRHDGGRWALSQSLYFTRYSNRFSLDQATVSVRLLSYIMDIGYKASLDWGGWTVGIDAAHHTIRPQDPSVEGYNVHTQTGAGRQRALELSLWAEWGRAFGRAEVNAGLRSTLYATSRGTRASADPTASVAVALSPGSRLTLSAWARHQYLVKTGFSDIGLPTEFWFSTGYGQSPQYSLNASLRFEAYTARRGWLLSAEAYYKRLYHQVEYRGNVFDFLYDDYSLDNSLLSGDGHNYGLSLMAERRKGRLTGWVAYSYGRARRRFDDPQLAGWYDAAHERPHELNAVATFRLSPRWSFGATMVVASGTPFTRVERFYVLSNHVISEYGPHNGERLPPYVRLDLSVSYDFPVRHGRRSGINLSLYNATAHENVLFYRLKINEYEFAYRPFSFALRVMPSVNYYISF